MTPDIAWERYVKITGSGYECKKGLWAVYGEHSPQLEQEARHYFIQYYSDGEYLDNEKEQLCKIIRKHLMYS